MHHAPRPVRPKIGTTRVHDTDEALITEPDVDGGAQPAAEWLRALAWLALS